MNENLIVTLYAKAADRLNSGNDAWRFERAFAEEIVRECALTALNAHPDANIYRAILQRFELE